MSYAKRSKVKQKLPPFVAMSWEILTSKVFIDLTPSSGKALQYFRGKGLKVAYTRNEPENSIVFEFSYDEAERLGFASATFSKILKELIRVGFIDMAGYGGLRGFCKLNSKYRLSDRWRRYGEPDFEIVPRYPSEPV